MPGNSLAWWPGGLVRCFPAGGDAWDAASQAAANLWWVHLVLSLFQAADRPTQPVGPGPLSQPRRRAVGARSRQGTTDRPGRPQQQDHHQHAHAAHSETTPTRPGRLVLWRSPTLLRVFDSQVSSCSQVPVPPPPTPTSCNRRRNKNASGASVRRESHLLRRRVAGWVTRIVQQYLSADDRRDVSLPIKPEAVAR